MIKLKAALLSLLFLILASALLYGASLLVGRLAGPGNYQVTIPAASGGGEYQLVVRR